MGSRFPGACLLQKLPGLLALRLCEVPGVEEAVVVAADGVAYLKVDRRALDELMLRAFAAEA